MRHALGLVLCLAACGSAPGADIGPASAPSNAASADGASSRSVPAGIYFRHHTYDSCSDGQPCHEPRVAVLQVVDTPQEAERLAADLRQVGQGYPLVVHTDELGLADSSVEGIAVVAGLFVAAAEAEDFASAAGPGLHVAELADSDTAFDRLYAQSDERRQRIVVRLALDRRSRALPRSAVDGLYERQSLEARGDASWLDERLAALTPLCELAPGSVFVTLAGDPAVHWYEWAPARCGDEPVYVPWSDTLLGSTVTTDETGAVVLRQIASVECDQAYVESRPYDSGRPRH